MVRAAMSSIFTLRILLISLGSIVISEAASADRYCKAVSMWRNCVITIDIGSFTYVMREPSEEHPFDGKYLIVRGYTDTGRPSQNDTCRSKYEEVAAIINSRLIFVSGTRTWSALLQDISLPETKNGRASARISLSEKDIHPLPSGATTLSGAIEDQSKNGKESIFKADGVLSNEFCGNGYFELIPSK